MASTGAFPTCGKRDRDETLDIEAKHCFLKCMEFDPRQF